MIQRRFNILGTPALIGDLNGDLQTNLTATVGESL
jgi:hypothetical protein